MIHRHVSTHATLATAFPRRWGWKGQFQFVASAHYTSASAGGKKITIIDLESTGLSTSRDRILEVAAVSMVLTPSALRMNGSFSTLVDVRKSGVPEVPPAIQQLTGIKTSDLEGTPSVGEVLPELVRFLSGTDALVAHNISFDWSLLSAEMNRLQNPSLMDGIEKIPYRICSLQLARRLLPQQKSFTLDAVAECLGIRGLPDKYRHRALDDCILTSRVLKSLLGIASSKLRWHPSLIWFDDAQRVPVRGFDRWLKASSRKPTKYATSEKVP